MVNTPPPPTPPPSPRSNLSRQCRPRTDDIRPTSAEWKLRLRCAPPPRVPLVLQPGRDIPSRAMDPQSPGICFQSEFSPSASLGRKNHGGGRVCMRACVFACVCVCVIYHVRADSVSLLILKAAPFWRDLSNADVHTSTSHNPPHPPTPFPPTGIILQPHGINKIPFLEIRHLQLHQVFQSSKLSSLSRTTANLVHPRHTSGIDPSIFQKQRWRILVWSCPVT